MSVELFMKYEVNSRIQSIINHSRSVIFYWRADENWSVEYVSKNIDLFGYKEDDFISGRVPYASIVHPDDLKKVGEDVAYYTEQGVDQFRQAYRIIDANGQTRWIDDHTVIERDKEGVARYYLGTILDITEQKEVENLSQFFGKIVDQSTNGIYIFASKDLQLSYLNKVAQEDTGFRIQKDQRLTVNDLQLDTGSDSIERLILPLKEGKETTVFFEAKQLRQDGVLRFVEVRVQRHESEDPLQYVAVVRDISERKQLENIREQQHQFVQSVLDGLSDSVMVIRTDYGIEWMNQSAQKSANFELVEDMNNPKCYEVSHHRNSPCDGLEHPCPLQNVLSSEQPVTVIHNHGHHGVDHFVELTAKPLRNEHNEIYAIVEAAHDITAMVQAQESLKEQAEKMSYQATHDDLTGLFNSRTFDDLCEQSLLRAKRLSTLLAVVFIDVDKFKQINDSLGHQVGDEVLIEVAQRLQRCVRVTDTVARLGGDEFILLLEGVHQRQEIVQILDKIIRGLKVPILTECEDVEVTLSLGAAIYPQDGSERKTLVRHADFALYDVKTNGRNGFRFFDELDSFS